MTAPEPELQELACMETIELIRADHKRTVDELLEALGVLVYVTEHPSKAEDDGSHWFKISKDAIPNARALIAKHRKGG